MGRSLEVLRGIDLEIDEGEIVAIVGPSGAGKSTLLHCIGTLDLPTSGNIELAGEDITLGTARAKKLAAVHDLFFEINKARGTTIVVVTHNASFAERMPRVVHLRDGKVEKDIRRTDPRPAGAAALS